MPAVSALPKKSYCLRLVGDFHQKTWDIIFRSSILAVSSPNSNPQRFCQVRDSSCPCSHRNPCFKMEPADCSNLFVPRQLGITSTKCQANLLARLGDGDNFNCGSVFLDLNGRFWRWGTSPGNITLRKWCNAFRISLVKAMYVWCRFCPTTHTGKASSMTLWLETACQYVMKYILYLLYSVYVYMCTIYAPIMLRWNSLHQNQPVLPSFSIATIGLGAAQCGRHAAAAHVGTSYLWYTTATHYVSNTDMQKQSQNWILKRFSMSFAVEFHWYISWWSVFHCNVSLPGCRCT